jgi:hypothetical protein
VSCCGPEIVGREVYPEIWDVIGPMLEHVVRTGEASWSTDLMLLLERRGYPEETYHTFSYTPIRDRTGKIVRVITPVTETTERALSERRLLSLRDLAARSVDAKSEQEAWAFAAQALSTNPYDISCAVPYKLDEHSAKATAVSHVGVRRDDPFFLEQVELDSSKPEGLAPALHKAVITGRAVELNAENGFRLSLQVAFGA